MKNKEKSTSFSANYNKTLKVWGWWDNVGIIKIRKLSKSKVTLPRVIMQTERIIRRIEFTFTYPVRHLYSSCPGQPPPWRRGCWALAQLEHRPAQHLYHHASSRHTPPVSLFPFVHTFRSFCVMAEEEWGEFRIERFSGITRPTLKGSRT